MKQGKLIRYVKWTSLNGVLGFAITDTKGEVETFYPGREIREPEETGYGETIEISRKFFEGISRLQSAGVIVIFS